MTRVFEHIEQVNYMLTQMFDNGFLHTRDILNEIGLCREEAVELGLSRASELLFKLEKGILLIRGDEEILPDFMLNYSNILSYYQVLNKMAVVWEFTEMKEEEK